MKRYVVHLALAAAVASGWTPGAAAQDITQAEKEKALRYLDSTRNALLDASQGLSEAQWNFKPAPDRWSAAEVVEHLAVLENLFLNGIRPQLLRAPADRPETDLSKLDATILARVPDRSTKVKAPEILAPTGRWSPQAALDHFLTDRQETAVFLTSTANLRGHVMPHPVLGPLDAYEWVLAVAAHTDRHAKQILELKADPHFPAN